MPGHDVIVIGASAGGLPALKAVLGALPADLPAALFVALHARPERTSQVSDLVSRMGPLPASPARDGSAIVHGQVYVSHSDRRVILESGRMRVVRGPRDRLGSAIDPLFRSAALAYGPRVVGVVLSGMLEDGASGLATIQKQGGTTVVQAPADALFPEMPRRALQAVSADHVLPAAAIADVLLKLAISPVSAMVEATEQLRVQVALERLGGPSVHFCRECGGALAELEDSLRLGCGRGHDYSLESLLAEHDDTIEDALWAVLGALVETAGLKQTLSGHAGVEGGARLAQGVGVALKHAEGVRRLLCAMATAK
jgi:two-component system chemotaxis response regulator CheB